MPNPGDILIGKYNRFEYEYVGSLKSYPDYHVIADTGISSIIVRAVHADSLARNYSVKPTFFEEGKTYEENGGQGYKEGSTFTVKYVLRSPDTDKLFAFGWWRSSVEWLGSDAVGATLSEDDFPEFKEVG